MSDQALVAHLLGRPIAFHRSLVSIGAGVTGALMLSQAIYWSSRTGENSGWFYKTQKDWEIETGLTRYEQDSARKKLKSLGLIQEIKRGVPCKVHYRVDFDMLTKLVSQFVEKQQTSMRETSITVCGKPANKLAENQQSITENTHRLPETTTIDSGESKSKTETVEKPAKKKQSKLQKMPEDFKPTQQHLELAGKAEINLELEFQQFVDYHQAKGSKFADWHAALRTWIRNAAKFKQTTRPGAYPPKPGVYHDKKQKRDYSEGVNDDGTF
ncbi:MAG: hypothetical protein IBX55_12985 [Methyloprofundus sp.]|nr:hypothetical protein [Methyloprofundus sp.]